MITRHDVLDKIARERQAFNTVAEFLDYVQNYMVQDYLTQAAEKE